MPGILFLFAPDINEKPGQLKPAVIACQFIEFYKPCLYLLMSGGNLTQAPAKLRSYQLRILQGHVQETI